MSSSKNCTVHHESCPMICANQNTHYNENMTCEHFIEKYRARVGKRAIDFTATTVMPNNSFTELNAKTYASHNYLVLIFYPLDFTFVCPSEIIAFNNRLEEANACNSKILLISVDSHHTHLAWKNTAHDKGGIGNIQIPMVSDINKKISTIYGICNDNGVALRATVIIDKHFIVRSIEVNDLSFGRNADEILRKIYAIEHASKHGEVCPAGWQKGDRGITQSREGIADFLRSHGEGL